MEQRPVARSATMIESKIRKQGNSYVVTIPRAAMEKYQLREGQQIAFTPTPAETRYQLRPEVQRALDRVIENSQEAFAYLDKH
jgi:antitoxin component of MazEF toxin-antitoxin module